MSPIARVLAVLLLVSSTALAGPVLARDNIPMCTINIGMQVLTVSLVDANNMLRANNIPEGMTKEEQDTYRAALADCCAQSGSSSGPSASSFRTNDPANNADKIEAPEPKAQAQKTEFELDPENAPSLTGDDKLSKPSGPPPESGNANVPSNESTVGSLSGPANKVSDKPKQVATRPASEQVDADADPNAGPLFRPAEKVADKSEQGTTTRPASEQADADADPNAGPLFRPAEKVADKSEQGTTRPTSENANAGSKQQPPNSQTLTGQSSENQPTGGNSQGPSHFSATSSQSSPPSGLNANEQVDAQTTPPTGPFGALDFVQGQVGNTVKNDAGEVKNAAVNDGKDCPENQRTGGNSQGPSHFSPTSSQSPPPSGPNENEQVDAQTTPPTGPFGALDFVQGQVENTVKNDAGKVKNAAVNDGKKDEGVEVESDVGKIGNDGKKGEIVAGNDGEMGKGVAVGMGEGVAGMGEGVLDEQGKCTCKA